MQYAIREVFQFSTMKQIFKITFKTEFQNDYFFHNSK